MQAKRDEALAARAALDKALVDFLPRLGVSFSYTRYSPVTENALGNLVGSPQPGPVAPGTPLVAAPVTISLLDQATMLTSSLSLPVSDYLFRLTHAHGAAQANERAAHAALIAAQRKVSFEARALYYQWVRAELDVEVAKQNLTLSQEHLTHVKSLSDADSALAADVARVEATVAGAELVWVRAQNLATLERERCAIAMHDDGPRAYLIGEDLQNLPVLDLTLSDVAALVRRAEERRPELRALTLQASAYEHQAKMARAQALPRIDASGQVITANPNPRYFPQEDAFHTTWQVGAQLSLSPNDVLTGRTQIRAAQAKARSLRAERSALSDAVRVEVTQAVLAHRDAMAAVDASARRLSAAETSYRARRDRYLVGMATTLELTEAQNELFGARLDAVQAQVAVRLARTQLDYATGGGE